MRMTAWGLGALFLAPAAAWARAGGAGGGHSSSGGGGFGGGGGGDGGISFLFDLIFILLRAGPLGWLVLAVLAFVAYKLFTLQKGVGAGVSIPASHYHNPGAPFGAAVHSNEEQFTRALPGEDLKAFREKAAKAFYTIQEGWSAKNVSHMRRFISDGVAQRFQAQFTMMNLLEQTDVMSQVAVHALEIAKVEQDGAYECVDVMVRASAADQFVCAKFPELNSPGGNEAFTEFWTFVRRKDHRPGKDIFHSENCPQCGAPLNEKLVDTARCPYCGSHLNSGEFDWVLAEITQDVDYGVEIPLPKAPDRGVAALRAVDPGFSTHLLEDKTSNAFMEVLIGIATGQSALAKRFTTDQAFADLTAAWPKTRLVYDRLFTRAVELLRVELEGTQARAYVAIRYSYHHVDLAHPQAFAQDVEPSSTVTVLGMVRDFGGETAKGSVYAGTCPHCGAPQKDNLSPLCDHCGSQLNDQSLDWVLGAILEPGHYRALGEAKATAGAPA